MKNSEKKKHIYLKNYPNVYRIFQKTLRFWYAKAIGSIILCIFMTIISIRLLHKGSIETAILFGFFTYRGDNAALFSREIPDAYFL